MYEKKVSKQPPQQPKKLHVRVHFLVVLCISVLLGLLCLASILLLRQPKHQKPTPDPRPFEEYSQQVTELVRTKDPTAALEFIEREARTNSKMMELCHPLVHLVGQLAYEKYGDFAAAIAYQDDTCGSGYLHGVIEKKFITIKDPVAEMKTICSSVPKDDLDTCFHGVGHGLMYYHENDVPKSIGLCQTYTDHTAKIRCAEGVFMENFSTTEDSLHSTKYLRESDPFYPCNEQPANLKNVCYFYTSIYYLHLHPRLYSQGLENCLNAEADQQYACAKGIGSRVMKENLSDIYFDESVCTQATDARRTACIEGLASYHLINFGSLEQTRLMCTQLEIDDQTVCLKYVARQVL